MSFSSDSIDMPLDCNSSSITICQKDPRSDSESNDPSVSANLLAAPAVSRTVARAERCVTFDDALTTFHEITPYAEVYGIHPRYFNFDRQEVPIAWCFVCPDDTSNNQNDTDSEEEVEQPTPLRRKDSLSSMVPTADKGQSQDDENSTESTDSLASDCSGDSHEPADCLSGDDEEEQMLLSELISMRRQLSTQNRCEDLVQEFCKLSHDHRGQHTSPISPHICARATLLSAPSQEPPVLSAPSREPPVLLSQLRCRQRLHSEEFFEDLLSRPKIARALSIEDQSVDTDSCGSVLRAHKLPGLLVPAVLDKRPCQDEEQPVVSGGKLSYFLAPADKGQTQDDEASTESPDSSASECSDGSHEPADCLSEDEEEQNLLSELISMRRQLSIQNRCDDLYDEFCKLPTVFLGEEQPPISPNIVFLGEEQPPISPNISRRAKLLSAAMQEPPVLRRRTPPTHKPLIMAV